MKESLKEAVRTHIKLTALIVSYKEAQPFLLAKVSIL